MTTKAQQEAERVLENRRIAFTKRIHNLLGHIGERTSQKLIDARFFALTDAERVEYGPKADALAAELASVEPVGRVIHPLKVEAVKYAGQQARKRVEQVRVDLEKHGWDLNVAAPYPGFRDQYQADYKAKRDKHNFYSSLTDCGVEGYRRTVESIRKMSEKGIERFVSQSEEMAALQYDMFICKMVSKVGDVDSAEIEGSHVWGESYLTVKKGEVEEIWKTQQIMNYSVLGNPYLQWPSRIVKAKGR